MRAALLVGFIGLASCGRVKGLGLTEGGTASADDGDARADRGPQETGGDVASGPPPADAGLDTADASTMDDRGPEVADAAAPDGTPQDAHCNPVLAAGPSGCASNETCLYRSQGKYGEHFECTLPGMISEGGGCVSFSCQAGSTCMTVKCWRVCRLGVAGDCSPGDSCLGEPGQPTHEYGVCCNDPSYCWQLSTP